MNVKDLLLTKVYAQGDPTVVVPQPKEVRITQLGSLIGAIVGALLLFAALAAFIYLILGGIQWILSGGDKAGMEAARNKITHAIVGLIIVAAAWAIMALVNSFLGIDVFNFTLTKPF